MTIDPPLGCAAWTRAQWQSHVESSIGPWIDTMLELPVDGSTADEKLRSGIAENLVSNGLEVSGAPDQQQWTWRVRDDFDLACYERLMDQ